MKCMVEAHVPNLTIQRKHRLWTRWSHWINFPVLFVEGWSTIVHWGGIRLADFTRHFSSGSETASYVGLATPDEEYNVGLDRASAHHPQTLLCYEMNGKPLTEEHGAPLRLVIPVKYGIKHIKRIGSITYTDERPDDYWA